MDRKSKLRSREMGHDAPPLESESEALSLSPSPPPRIGGNLSSMVVKPSLSSGGGSDLDIGYAADVRPRGSPPHHFRRGPQDPHRHDSPSSNRRRFGSPPLHRRVSPDSFSRRVSHPGLPRGGSPIGLHRRSSPPAFHPRSQRFQNGSVAWFESKICYKEERISLGTCFFGKLPVLTSYDMSIMK